MLGKRGGRIGMGRGGDIILGCEVRMQGEAFEQGRDGEAILILELVRKLRGVRQNWLLICLALATCDTRNGIVQCDSAETHRVLARVQLRRSLVYYCEAKKCESRRMM